MLHHFVCFKWGQTRMNVNTPQSWIRLNSGIENQKELHQESVHINESLAKWMQDLSVLSNSLQLHIHNLITVSHDHTACAVLWSLERWAAWWQLNFQSCRQLRQINLHIHVGFRIETAYYCNMSVSCQCGKPDTPNTVFNNKPQLHSFWFTSNQSKQCVYVSMGKKFLVQTMQGAACCIQVQVRHKVRIQLEEHRVELGGAC